MQHEKTILLRLLILIVSAAFAEGCARDVASPGSGGVSGGDTPHGKSSVAINRPDPPSTYEGKTNRLSGVASVGAGRKLFAANCVSCHGVVGKGDGPTSPSLNPKPTDFTKTIGGLKDDYLFWRISEGGVFPPFNSAMIGWKDKFSEEDRWNLITYLHTLQNN